jgi:hypothetical protein
LAAVADPPPVLLAALPPEEAKAAVGDDVNAALAGAAGVHV